MSGGVLVAFGGLPGVGKSTVARALCASTGAVHLRIDTIEAAVCDALQGADPGAAGYTAAYGVALDNLRLGRSVVADCVNPAAVTRNAWRHVAADAGRPIVEVVLVCSDPDEHRRRVEARLSGEPGPRQPDWPAVEERLFEPPDPAALILDTARLDPDEAVRRIVVAMDAASV